MTFDVTALTTFLDRAAGLLHDVRFYAGLGLLRNERMADRARELPGCVLPDAAYGRIVLGDGLRLAKELARRACRERRAPGTATEHRALAGAADEA
jgi:hypothetical protein